MDLTEELPQEEAEEEASTHLVYHLLASTRLPARSSRSPLENSSAASSLSSVLSAQQLIIQSSALKNLQGNFLERSQARPKVHPAAIVLRFAGFPDQTSHVENGLRECSRPTSERLVRGGRAITDIGCKPHPAPISLPTSDENSMGFLSFFFQKSPSVLFFAIEHFLPSLIFIFLLFPPAMSLPGWFNDWNATLASPTASLSPDTLWQSPTWAAPAPLQRSYDPFLNSNWTPLITDPPTRSFPPPPVAPASVAAPIASSPLPPMAGIDSLTPALAKMVL